MACSAFHCLAWLISGLLIDARALTLHCRPYFLLPLLLFQRDTVVCPALQREVVLAGGDRHISSLAAYLGRDAALLGATF